MSGKQRLSASVDADLVATAQEAVDQGRAESMSAWVNAALRLKADQDRRMAALDDFLAGYEAEHGPITEEDMRAAARAARGRAIVVRDAPGPQQRPARGPA
jgi:Arc/MetJ-type ribon-helix-helix transcriptional regulator